MLIGGGELLVIGAVKLARHLGMRPMLIGLTIVAFGTSLPEMFVSLTASLAGYTDIMIGNVVGSNIANIGLILGISVLLYPLKVHFERVSLELYLVSAASLLVVGIGLIGFFYRIFGLVFVACLILYTFLAYQRTSGKKTLSEGSEEGSSTQRSKIFLQIVLCLAGILLLALGSDLFIDGAVDLARYFDVSELVVGLTLAALGTSLPELVTSFSAIRRRQSDILVGNVVGSNFFNLLMVMGGTALVKPFAISSRVLYRDLPFMVGLTLILIPLLKRRRRMLRGQGLFLLGVYGIYIYILTL